MKALIKKINRILKDRRTRRLLTRIVSVSAALVVFVTTYALVLPAITMEAEAQCGIEAHQHDDSCYEDVLVCGQEESEGHTHDESCYSISQELICEIPEHQHDETCYDEDGNLQCQMQEHEHTDDCYKEVRELTCTLEESEGHHHTDSCYEKNLICGKEVHTHSPDCYEKEAADAVAVSTGYTAGTDSSIVAEEIDHATVENQGTEESAAAATTNVLLPEDLQSEDLSDGYVPQLDSLYFDAVLNNHTAFYYFHPEEGEEVPANSADITSWKLVDKNTELAPTDLVKVYLAYTIPAGSLNETNQIARYRLPANIHLTDDQILAINNNENGIAAGYVDPSTNTVLDEDADNYHKYLGAEAVEGTRRPDQDSRNAGEDGFGDTAQEYISATVKAENVFDEEGLYGEKGAYLGQDLIFVFSPYTIEKNQTTYDTAGNPTAKGEKVTGWFAVDLNMEQIDWVEEETREEQIGQVTEEPASEQADQIGEEPVSDQTDQSAEETAPDQIDQSTDEVGQSENTNKTINIVRTTIVKSAEIIFAEKNKDVKASEISRRLKLVEYTEREEEADAATTSSDEVTEADTAAAAEDAVDETVDEGSVEDQVPDDAADADSTTKEEQASEGVTSDDKDQEAEDKDKEKQEPEYKDGSLTSEGDDYKITLDYTAEAKIPAEAVLSVREITAETDPEVYQACLDQASAHTSTGDSTIDQQASRFFDIEIVVKDEEGQQQKIEPEAPVSVNIQLPEKKDTDKEQARKDNNSKDKGSNSKETKNEDSKGSASQDGGSSAKNAASTQDPTVLHFAEKGVEQVEAETSVNETKKDTATEVQFQAESFSIYGVIYTVDFHWEVDGQMYEFSLPGGGFISFSDLIEVLGVAKTGENDDVYLPGEVPGIDNQDANGENNTQESAESADNTGYSGVHNPMEVPGINDQDATGENGSAALTLDGVVVSEKTREFVADVKSVVFSSPELVDVSKVESETTVGGIKESRGLDVQYSAELTEEQIAEINAQTVVAGDWALISVQPFESTESLTVTMKTGEVFEIRVTDAQLKKTVKTASGETWEITITYDDSAEIPKDAELRVEEILPEDERYEQYYQQSLEKISVGEVPDTIEDESGSEMIDETAETASEEAATTTSYAHIFDIQIWAGDQQIEPASGSTVSVSIKLLDAPENEDTNLQVVHFGKDGLEVMELAENNDETKAGGTELNFVTDEFSVYAIVGTGTITVPFVAGDGRTYEVTVTYGEDAGIPAGSTLAVSELREDREEYQDYLEQTADAVGTAADALNYIKILDISIMNGEEEVAIQAPVDVQIKLLDKDHAEGSAGEKTKVVHFGESETDVIDPDLNGTTVNFEAAGFSYYAVTTYGATSDLNGKSYAIVWVKTVAADEYNQRVRNHTVYRGRALATDPRKDNTRLGGATVSVETHESGLNLVTGGTTQIVKWEFKSAGALDTYYIKAPNGQYLNLKGADSLELSDTPQALTVTAGTGDYEGKVKISYDTRSVQSSMDAATTDTVNDNQYFYNGDSNEAGKVYLTLCEVKEFSIGSQEYSGEKISVQVLKDGKKYLIYRTIYNETTKKYEDWIIDGDGNPVRAYDQGDSLSLYSNISPMWTLDILKDAGGQPTGYYIFRNEATKMILHPLADGTLVREYDAATSPATDGVSLKGREGGAYTSTIEYWDESAMTYYGYQFTTEDGVVGLKTGTGDHSQALSFAEEKKPASGLHEVTTVDSKAAGITIHMFDYPNKDTIDNVTGEKEYLVGVLPDSHVEKQLVGGYPVFTNGNSGSALFDPGNAYYKGDGNHLFLESVFNATGYYEYSAFNNFAHYSVDPNTKKGNFTVYQETGTPDTSSNRFFFKRGNFLPFNSLDESRQIKNLYAGDGTILDYENPNYESTLYGIKDAVNHFFGMTMEFNFLIPKDGYDNGNPLVYEFNGDDDLWIFIDDVLILDIGGVHDAFPGTINFATGEITGGHGGAGGARTIKGCFENAKVFPDGTKWDYNRVDEYFKGDTFISYGSHKFNMFYMEHGEGASNLQTRFNLPVIKKGNVTVEKKLDHTSQVDYANVSFAYQAFAKDGLGDYKPLTSAVYEGTNKKVAFHNGVKFSENGTVYNNVFYLKPGEAAVFSNMIEDELYYVQELGIDDDYYDKVFVNEVQIVGEQGSKVDGIYKSTAATAKSRARVTFTNRCSEGNTNELRITKRLADPSENNGDTFEFRVMLENASGVLSDYYQGTYYIRDDAGVYYRYDGGRLVSNGQTPYACAAGNNGTIAHIPPNYTVVIKDLVAGTDFYVDEIRVRPNGSSSDVLLANSDWILQSRDVSDCDAAEIQNAYIYDYASGTTITNDALGRIAWNKDAQVVFTNKLASVDVQLNKVREDGTTTISGSVFDLHKYGNSWTSVQTAIEPGKAAAGTTPAVPNPVDLGELGIGRYRLTETKAPDGYIILTKHIYFQVYRDTDGIVKARLTDEVGTALDSPADMAAIVGPGTGDTPAYTITVKNTPGAVLPNTGGSGTLPYTLGGLMLIIASALMYGFRMRRKERRTN